MRILRIAFRRETAAPMLALTFTSAVNVALVIARIAWSGNIRYGFLLWNLFLAWLPLVFAMLACEHYQNSGKRSWRFGALAVAWLLFFPNAPYIFTDLVHLNTYFYQHFWVDLVLILMCALTGLIIGFLSLYLMQTIVARLAGVVASWVFIALAAGLGSFGICLGRFLRFNSWDVVTNPAKLYHGLGTWTLQTGYHPSSVAFTFLFAAFLFTAYLMLYALTHLSPAQMTFPRPATAASPNL